MQATMSQTVTVVTHHFCGESTLIGVFDNEAQAHNALMTALPDIFRATGITDPIELRESIVNFIENCTSRINIKIGTISATLADLV